jgi:6-phosphofructokinase 1
VVGCRYGFEGLLDPSAIVPLRIEHVRGILPRGGCVLGCSTRVNPFFVASKMGEAPRDFGASIVERLRAQEIDALVLVGGDGTMLAARRFMRLGMPCIGIPKTIDNDLARTEMTCGFDSAVETATRAIDALHSTAEAHARIMIVEVMGRNAGFIALYAGVAGGADVILIPEIPYALEPVLQKVREREALGLRFSIVVVAEGARPIGGEVAEIEEGRPGYLPRLGGAGERLMKELERSNTGHEVRLTVLGHLQRGGSPSAFDRNLGTGMGAYAAELCAKGHFGRMVSFVAGSLESTPLDADAALHKEVDRQGSLMTAARSAGIQFGD